MGNLAKAAKEKIVEEREAKALIQCSDDGGTSGKYRIPKEAKMIQDLIEYRNMNFAEGNIFKALYRKGNCSHSDTDRDTKKVAWFAARELNRLNIEDDRREFMISETPEDFVIIKIK